MAQRVTIYHDETHVETQDGHCLLFVPRQLSTSDILPLFGTVIQNSEPAEMFLTKLLEIRQRFGLTQKLHFTELSGRAWSKYDLATRLIADNLVDALRHRRCTEFSPPLCFKAAMVLYPHGADLTMYGGQERQEQRLRHDETVLRMLLKGASHFLYSRANPLVVERIVSDGLPSHRPFDQSRVVQQLYVDELAGRTPLRDYVEFSPDCTISHVLSDHKEHQLGTRDYVDAHFLQMVDLLLGSALCSLRPPTHRWATTPRIGSRVASKKEIVAHPIRDMLAKYTRGRAFEHSGHFRAFTFNRIEFTDAGPTFKSMEIVASPAPSAGDDLRIL